jgi:predicted acyl esterase
MLTIIYLRKIAILNALIFLGFSATAQLTPVVDSIPMRDGKKLAADIHIPTGCTQCPTILIQTPYNRQAYRWSLPLGIGLNVNSSDYIYVITDWRGFNGSLAAFDINGDNGEDGYDVVEWITQQSWSDGKIGTWGPSALGNVQYETAREQHPNHICAVPLVAAPQTTYEEFYPGGVLITERIEQLDLLGFGVSPLVIANPTRNFTWAFVENSTFYPDSIHIPMFMIGGWYDHNVEVMFDFYDGLRQDSDISVRDDHKILMGPWAHGGFGAAYVGTPNQGELNFPEAAFWSDSLALRFFDYYLRNLNNNWDQEPEIRYFQIGENAWKSSTTFPDGNVNTVPFHLLENNLLEYNADVFSGAATSFTYDPTDPSPTVGGPTLRSDQLQGPYDQKDSVEVRNDIELFTSQPFPQDVILRGAPIVHLEVSSDRFDTDFAVRLTDVYPDGTSMLISDGIQRMRFRDGYAAGDTSNIVPGTHYNIEIELPKTAYTFLTGHSVRVDVSSSNYPRFNRNMNTGAAMYPGGDGDILVNPLVATNAVYHTANSYLELPLVDFTLSIAENEVQPFELKVYPNPANGNVNVVFEMEQKAQLQIDLIDITGKHIKQLANGKFTTGSHQISADLEQLSNGLYLVRIISENGIQAIQKLTISH